MTDPDELRERAEQILDRREFRDPEQSLFERLMNWIGERISDVLDPIFSLFGVGGVGAGAAQLIGLVLLTAFVILVIVAVTKLRVRRLPRQDAFITTSLTTSVSAAQWRAEAAEHETNGRWAQAVRCHYRAAMAELVEGRRLVDRPGATAGTWREEVLATDADPESVVALTRNFEGVWYGNVEADASDADAARRDGDTMVGR